MSQANRDATQDLCHTRVVALKQKLSCAAYQPDLEEFMRVAWLDGFNTAKQESHTRVRQILDKL